MMRSLSTLLLTSLVANAALAADAAEKAVNIPAISMFIVFVIATLEIGRAHV